MENLNGPDQLIPCDNITTTKPDGCVKFRCTNSYFEKSYDLISLPGLLHKTAAKYPDNIALINQDDNGFLRNYTYRQYEDNVKTCAKAFLKLGLERFHSVCILGFNSPEWFFSEFGAIYAGGIATGIYTTNTSEACHHILEHSRANIAVVEDNTQLQKILAIRDRLPLLKVIVQYKGKPKHDDVLSWAQLMEIGQQESDEELNNVLKKIAINQCCIIVYTSGTVGKPKGVMLSHDNIVYNSYAIREHQKMEQFQTFVSYLPLSHIAAQIVDIFLTLTTTGTTFFADKQALKGSLLTTLKLAKPTSFLGVPRVWEKIRENLMAVGAQSGFLKKNIAAWAKAQALQHNMDRANGENGNSWGYTLASTLVLGKIKQALGFERCKVFASAAAPLSLDVKKYFFSIDFPVYEAFGMSEVAGAHTMGNCDNIDLESVGLPLPGVKTKIINLDENNHGEICMYGRHVFMGYLLDEEKTAEAIDEDGWLRSGDIGYIDEKNKVFVTGRIKELIITAGGENVAPVPIEQKVVKELPCLSHAMLIGDKRKFLTMLLTLKTELEPKTGNPTDTLTKDVEIWLKDLGCDATTVTELIKSGPSEKVLAAIQKKIDKVNSKAVSNAQRIQKFAILPQDFSIASGELGPTLKLRRNIVVQKYSELIDKFYD